MSEQSGPMWNQAEGAAAERTDMAWRRTVLGGTVVGVLAIRLAVRHPADVLHVLIIAAIAIGWVVLLVLAHRRISAMRVPTPSQIGRTLPIVAIMTAGVAVLAIVLVVVPS